MAIIELIVTIVTTIVAFIAIAIIIYGISTARGAIMSWENRRTPINYRYPGK